MTWGKVRRALLLVGFIVGMIFFTKGGNGALIAFYKNRIARRKNEVDELAKKEADLKAQIGKTDSDAVAVQAQLDDIQKRKTEIKQEVSRMSDAQVANEVGDLLKSL